MALTSVPNQLEGSSKWVRDRTKPSQQNSVDEPQEAESLAVVPEVVEELTEAEISDRHRLELKVERGLEQVDQTFYG